MLVLMEVFGLVMNLFLLLSVSTLVPHYDLVEVDELSYALDSCH